MDLLANVMHGFSVALQWENLGWSLFGVFMGNLIGVLPGMGVLASISILLPLTYAMTPVAALMMLAGIYYGAQYGGGITCILLNLPGTPSHAVTCLDGNPLARQGKSGSALFMLVVSSFIGASIGITVMILFSPVLVEVAFQFGPAEYFSMMMLGLFAGATLAKGSAIKGVAMVFLGLLFGVVGTDVNTGTIRYAFGIMELSDGVQLVALAMGLFGLADFFANVNRIGKATLIDNGSRMSVRPEPGDIRKSAAPIARGSVIGSVLGILPGTGATIASFMSYATEKRLSKTPGRFGAGAIEGVAGPEAANNSAAQTSFIPTMSLGIPGDSVMALMLGALIIHGIQPGPQMVIEHADIFWGLVASFWVGNVLLVVMNLPLIGMWAKFLKVPYKYLYPAALFCVCVGVYSTNNNLFDVGMVLVLGLVGYVFLKLRFSPAPLLLGFVLGPMVEENFRRALLLSRGSMSVFVDRPISAAFVYAIFALAAWLTYTTFRDRRRVRRLIQTQA
ncbi:tripartite tricarboxylate transporter permease [Bordetella petrii]|uniref:Tripartite tricarboxylate transporter permease n=1 Tax=Bordetella petrii TaxID=94624 RepID=A0ABT7VZ05_9BORD|nr:tripartite tricarboxylate transporter permease [Bordetella petrii]MDM9558142.1 tripartite tricarboxylate transporter permease [Bordetella petrii]